MLHEMAKHLYRFSKRLFGLQILTENGFEDLASVNATAPTETVVVRTASARLTCSRRHVLIDEDGEEVYAEDSLGRRVKTASGKAETVLSVEPGEKQELYDVSMAGGTSHTYFANGLLSHNCVICDEFSFVPNNIANKVFESIYPVISSSKKSKFIIVSTPNGADPNNLYYSLWQQANQKTAEKNKEGWRPFRMDWWDVPGRDEHWKEMTMASIGQKRFAQEFGNEFLASGQSRKLVPDDIIERHRMQASKDKAAGKKPVEQRILSEDEQKVFKFRMWREFDPSRTYAAAADIAEGVGGDSSVLYVFDVTDLSDVRMCAAFSSNDTSLVEFAYVCSKILPLYGSPPLFAERNGVSAGTLDSLRITYGYQNIARESRNGETGIYSHVTVKSRACLWARDMLTTAGFGFWLPDQALIDEMGTFVKKDTSGRISVFQAAAGSHDDHIMAFVWLCWGLSRELVEKYFVVAKTFESQLGETMPAVLAPAAPYSGAVIKEIKDDPVYKRFREIVQEAEAAFGRAESPDKDGKDSFVWNRQPVDQYFQDDWIGPSWDQSGGANLSKPVSPNNQMPAFFVS